MDSVTLRVGAAQFKHPDGTLHDIDVVLAENRDEAIEAIQVQEESSLAAIETKKQESLSVLPGDVQQINSTISQLPTNQTGLDIVNALNDITNNYWTLANNGIFFNEDGSVDIKKTNDNDSVTVKLATDTTCKEIVNGIYDLAEVWKEAVYD